MQFKEVGYIERSMCMIVCGHIFADATVITGTAFSGFDLHRAVCDSEPVSDNIACVIQDGLFVPPRPVQYQMSG